MVKRRGQVTARGRRKASAHGGDDSLPAYTEMVRIRAFEEKASQEHRAGRLAGLLHLSMGGEAVAVGVIGQLSPADRIYTSHRGHGHFLAAGVDPRTMFAELLGRETGLCRGRGGSMHLSSERVVTATGDVGGTLPIAVGHAVANTLIGGDERALVVVFFGDGAVQTGVFHESLNLASLWNAPTLFVCENNGWVEFTPREAHTTVKEITSYPAIFGIASTSVDGGDVSAVVEATSKLLQSMREGGGPAFLECHTTRMRPHYEGDLRLGESGKEDPLTRTETKARQAGTSEADFASAREAAAAEMIDAFDQALADPLPEPEDDPSLVAVESSP